MTGTLIRTILALIATALMVVALWAWGRAWEVTEYATRPDVAAWAVRSSAVAAAALAQVLALSALIRRRQPEFPGQRAPMDASRLTFGIVGSIALISAIALGLAGR
jgi:type VI protein secretion system component VasK